MADQTISLQVPENGVAISIDANGQWVVPDRPIIPFIEGDGIGIDITPVMQQVVNAAVEKAYAGARQIQWMEIYAGEKSAKQSGEDQYLPAATLQALKDYLVAIKGPLTTPVGGGIRSLNVALRQQLDLYICLRPVRYFPGTPSPLRHPEYTDMVIFRENSEDIYAGIEFAAGTKQAKQLIDYLQQTMGVTQIRFEDDCGMGVKPISKAGTTRLVRAAIQYAIDHDRESVTFVHKGNIMKFTEGAFKDWGYELAVSEFAAQPYEGGPWQVLKNPRTGQDIIIKDTIADAFLQQILLRPKDYDVIATMNLNGDYISDALAAQVGGIGIAPGANLGEQVALFEATHGTAPGYAGQDKVNPGSLILSAEMMLRHMGWDEAADCIIAGISKAIANKTVTYDFERMMKGGTLCSCSEFGEEIIKNM